MAMKKKDARPISAKLQAEVYELLEKFTEDSGLSKTVTIERALKMYIEDYYSRMGRPEGRKE